MNIKSQFNSVMQALPIKNKIAVAVSGGVDSMALLLLVHRWSLNNKVVPFILTVNHGLREESNSECQYVKDFSHSLALECRILTWEKPIKKQNSARIARYDLLTKWCKENNIYQLLLAHHQNDQAETVFMRITRGSGIDGICGMQELSNCHGIELIRPLLAFTKQQLTDYVKMQNVTWVDDPSNYNQKYNRTIVRDYINSHSDSTLLVARLGLTARHMQRVKEAITFYTYQAIKSCVKENELGYVNIMLDDLYQLPEEIAMRVILACMMVIGNKIYKPRYKNFEDLFMSIWQGKFSKSRTLHGCRITRKNNIISIKREVTAISSLEIDLSPEKQVIWDNRFLCTSDVIVKICKNNSKSELTGSVPMLKINDKCIYPFKEKIPEGISLKFVFSELLRKVL